MKLKFGAILAAGFVALSVIATATGNFAVRLDAATKLARQAQIQAGIMVDRIHISRGSATGYRQVTEHTGAVAPNTGFNIYFEPTGLTTRFQNGQVQASMSIDVLIRNTENVTVAVQDNAWQLPIGVAAEADGPLTSVYGDLAVNPLNLPEGKYEVVLRIHDDFSGKFADRVIDLEIGQPQAAQRLSQAAPQQRQ